jgi:5-formyltetrahydrofolate cyclo-ligase
MVDCFRQIKAIQAWRQAERQRLIHLRLALPGQEKTTLERRITQHILRAGLVSGTSVVGFYWPMFGEVDLRPLIEHVLGESVTSVALPVVVERRQPLEFWEWKPDSTMVRGVWNIPIPSPAKPVRPEVLFIPLVGFDHNKYRLGHGAGYYDRTLAALTPRPLSIGIGFEILHLPTIYPQPHDIPMDIIVTDAGVRN